MQLLKPLQHHTKIVVTIGPASNSPEMIRKLLKAGMNVARLNFSHGKYEDHARCIENLRAAAAELDLPLMLLQDLQGPKIRVGDLPPEGLTLTEGMALTLVPLGQEDGQPNTVPIDYPYIAEEAMPGTPVLLDDGLLELRVEQVQGQRVACRVVKGGQLRSRKGVNFPTLDLRLPAMTEKDKQDLEFGLAHGVDLISLSFVRRPEDVQELKHLLRQKGAKVPVLAKIEKPQAVENIEAIIAESDAIMVARGDLGVEMSPEKVPLIQKRIIHLCNQRGVPVITATQMLESMIHNPRPTRAEASDVANAIIDGTDAVMLSGESAVGQYPVEAVQMLARIAMEVEPATRFANYPANQSEDVDAITEAMHAIEDTLDLRCIVVFTNSGRTARLASAERPRKPIVAYTPHKHIYNQLSLYWGVRPILTRWFTDNVMDVLREMELDLLQRQYVLPGDKVLVMAGIPFGQAQTTNFLKIHTIGG
ncbi:MAG: pyruvate kinase [Gloeomargarita sp. SKYBB_i_bin120]|nr:pyruvate kinase [Gloeomargarita sp. SKYG98]MCS7291367.1 pyruvate kinase [Gloeomargarita sp. SKYB120]MDW8176927.1 pyruvate kinase [Gloeomargarita sp. SKYBB_i_bin120]